MKKISITLIFISLINSFCSSANVISAGSWHSIAIDHLGNVWSFGNGVQGQLGLGDIDGRHVPTKIMKYPDRIIATSAGASHTLLLDEKGVVWAFGDNTHFYLDKTRCKNFVKCNKKIIAISAGCYHSLLLDDQRRVWSFGYGAWGQLGHNDTKNKNIATKINGLSQDIVALAAAEKHSVLLDSEGGVWTFGKGDRGQLGHGDTTARFIPTKIEGFNQNIIAISAGNDFTLLLDKEGFVWSFGNGFSYQLGHEDNYNKMVPTKIIAVSEPIIAISAGDHHTVLLDCKGDVWTFGDGRFGQLGHNDTLDKTNPTKIEGLHPNIIAISAGGEHTLLLDEEGFILSFGHNCFGHLGHGNTQNQLTPTRIETLPFITLVDQKSKRTKNAASRLSEAANDICDD